MSWLILLVVGLVILAVAAGVAWRWASRAWSLPCPSLFAWALESPVYGRMTGTDITLERIPLAAGQRVLEIGPGPGRLLIPAARRILPGGEAIGIDLQEGMVRRLQLRAREQGLSNLTAICADATTEVVPADSMDLAFLATTLGEIPNREAALAQCFRALKPGGILSVTEMLPDPHYQTRARVRRLAEQAGFQFREILGSQWLYTANFVKPRGDGS